ncbi:MAG: YCF48-related protein [bacterium]
MKIKKFKYIIIILVLFLSGFSSSISQWMEVTTVPAPYSNIYYLDIFFLNNNPNYGWACGYGGNVIRTTDGGETWNGTKVMDMEIDTIDYGGIIIYDTNYVTGANQLESIHFANEQVGYTSGDKRVYKSTDGGATWKSVLDTFNYKDDIWGVFFASPDTGVALGGGCDGRQIFRRTSDGAKSWTTFIGNEVESGLSDAILLSTNGVGYAASSGLIWKTTNGGITWNRFSVSGDRDWQEEITNFGNTFLIPFSEGCYGGGNSGGWRISTNNGQTWKEYKVDDVTFFGTYLLSDKKGWVCGQQQHIHYTSDGGETWELRNCGINKNAPLDDIWFVNDTLGWVVGRGVYKFHIYDTLRPKILSDSPLFFCEGDSINLRSDKIFQHYRWSNGDTTKETTVYSPGWYTLIAYNYDCDYVYPDSVKVQIFPKTDFEILTDKTPEFCEGDSIRLWIEAMYKDIIWSTGAKTDSIVVKDSGMYSVTIIDTNGCEYSQSINIIMHALPDAKIQNIRKLEFCEGDSVFLQTTENYFSYRWSKTTNPDSIISKNRKITVFHSGTYYVIVENEFGCIDTSESVTVNVLDLSNRLEIFSDKKPRGLDFDSLGLTNMICEYLNIINTSDEIVPLYDILLAWNIEFSVPQMQIPFYLYPGDTNRLHVCFRPLDLGIRRDTIIIGDTCSTHYIPLSGIGKENIYTAETDCDVDLIFTSRDVVGGEFFRVSKIYPHPVVNVCYIDFAERTIENSIRVSCSMRNTLGLKVAVGYMQNVKTINYDNHYIHSGQWVINAEDIPSGLYFIEIIHEADIKTLPILIIK